MRYLENGITGRWDRHWQVENALHEQVPEVLVRAWSLPVIGTAGIETLDGICAHPHTWGLPGRGGLPGLLVERFLTARDGHT